MRPRPRHTRSLQGCTRRATAGAQPPVLPPPHANPASPSQPPHTDGSQAKAPLVAAPALRRRLTRHDDAVQPREVDLVGLLAAEEVQQQALGQAQRRRRLKLVAHEQDARLQQATTGGRR
jgi:hypothetical protein